MPPFDATVAETGPPGELLPATAAPPIPTLALHRADRALEAVTGAADPRALAARLHAEAMRTTRGGTEAERMALAAQPATAPDLLYFLASDSAVAVRAAVAANAATPPQADRLLAGDADPRVRALLGRKLAGLAPLLGEGAPETLLRQSWETLCRLAADAAVMVRAMIAEEVQAMPDAPQALILQLARDAAMAVAEPVIRFSPLLTEADLLGLATAPPAPETLTAIARRPRIGERIADALAAAAGGWPLREAATTATA